MNRLRKGCRVCSGEEISPSTPFWCFELLEGSEDACSGYHVYTQSSMVQRKGAGWLPSEGKLQLEKE